MNAYIVSVLIALSCIVNRPQQEVRIETGDLTHFWEAYDHLALTTDSLQVIQKFYLDRATPALRECLLRNPAINAQSVLEDIRSRPHYYWSIRSYSLALFQRQAELYQALYSLKEKFPDFQVSTLCLIMGDRQHKAVMVHNGLVIQADQVLRDPKAELISIIRQDVLLAQNQR